MKDFWLPCVDFLSAGLPAAQVKQWLLPLSPIGFNEEETEFHILAPSALKQNWAKQFFAPKIEAYIKETLQCDVRVVVLLGKPGVASAPVSNAIPTVAPAEKSSAVPAPSAEPAPIATQGHLPLDAALDAVLPMHSMVDDVAVEIEVVSQPSTAGFTPVQKEPPQPYISALGTLEMPPELMPIYEKTGLSRLHTFSNLVVGDSNNLAHATALNVVKNAGQRSNNPLFLYGGTGLGKTHLMFAIGNELFRTGRIRNSRYINADTYYTEVARRMRDGQFLDYQDNEGRDYAGLDLLLIDDIQFFQRREQTQKQFFLLFEKLIRNKTQIVICSDTFPRELPDMSERLVSRFSSGLVIQIEPPEVDMRQAILQKKAEAHPTIALADEAAFFVAQNLKRNVRELEGALQKIMAYAAYKRIKTITVDVCRDALKDLLRVANSLASIEKIQKTVADFYKIGVADIYSKSRRANLVRARHVAMYLSKELTRKSLPEIGQSFGGRDHSTVHHAIERIKECRLNDSNLNHELHVLEQTLKG